MRLRLSESKWHRLVTAARQGADMAFLTKPGGTRYGAAVMTAGGAVFQAGQYSSFNHVTNIHAEMAAILAAVNGGDPTVIALALVSTSAVGNLPSTCGVCRQFMHEHSLRTGFPIEVCFASYDGLQRRVRPLDTLLPDSWNPRPKPKNASHWHPLRPGPSLQPLEFGALLAPRPDELGLVWEPEILPGRALVKMKYSCDPVSSLAHARYAHSFTEYDDYSAQLRERDLVSALPWGTTVCLVETKRIYGWLPPVPLHHAGLQKAEPLLRLCQKAGIPLDNLHLTASWAAGLAGADSDLDVIVEASPDQTRTLRTLLREEILAGRLLLPNQSSGTWKHLTKWSGLEGMEIIRSGRFAETFLAPSSSGVSTKFSLIYVRPGNPGERLPTPGKHPWPLRTLRGRVSDASEALYKRANYTVEEDTSGELHRFVCWHKSANHLLQGDLVECTAAAPPGHPSLYQIHPIRESIELIG